jgi:hypothetical protein
MINIGGPSIGASTSAGCCFDYGNSETNDRDDGCGTMEAIYFGDAHWHGNTGQGSGPWVGADLEQGVYFSFWRWRWWSWWGGECWL